MQSNGSLYSLNYKNCSISSTERHTTFVQKSDWKPSLWCERLMDRKTALTYWCSRCIYKFLNHTLLFTHTTISLLICLISNNTMQSVKWLFFTLSWLYLKTCHAVDLLQRNDASDILFSVSSYLKHTLQNLVSWSGTRKTE